VTGKRGRRRTNNPKDGTERSRKSREKAVEEAASELEQLREKGRRDPHTLLKEVLFPGGSLIVPMTPSQEELTAIVTNYNANKERHGQVITDAINKAAEATRNHPQKTKQEQLRQTMEIVVNTAAEAILNHRQKAKRSQRRRRKRD
jgi:hypothetical protein